MREVCAGVQEESMYKNTSGKDEETGGEEEDDELSTRLEKSISKGECLETRDSLETNNTVHNNYCYSCIGDTKH